MAQSFGAGFFVLTLLGSLGVVAAVATIGAVVAVALRERADGSERALGYLGFALGAVVVAITGFGALAMYDEAPAALWILVGIVVLPLALAIVERARDPDWSSLDGAASAVFAWAVPYLLALGVLFWLLARTDLAFTGATALASFVAVVWTLVASNWLGRVLWDAGAG